MSRFVPLKVKRIVRETPDANTIIFEKPAGSDFDYKPGQYLTLKVEVAGESLRRAYSLCSSPLTDADLAVTVKRVDGGRVSNYLPDNLKEGQSLEVMPPMGNFFLDMDKAEDQHFVLLGGGSGITPLMSILKSVLHGTKSSTITLIYGSRDPESIIFHDELKSLEAQFESRLRIIYSLDSAPSDWVGGRGRLDRQKLMPILQDLHRTGGGKASYWLCGPAPMMEEAKTALNFVGVEKSMVKQESFGAALPDPDKPKAEVSAKRGTYTITVVLDDEEKQVTVDEKKNILEAVIDDGMDPPYACQMGVCCTCRAKVLTGKVEMEEDEGLSDQEIDEGFILTCQAYPLTPDCKVEYM